MLKYSKYNIFSGIKDSDNFYIVNLLTGNADILKKEESEKIQKIRDEKDFSDRNFVAKLVKKGYLIDEDEETRLFRNKYLDYLDTLDSEEIQLFFVTNYSCNFSCSYCYQDQYSYPETKLNQDVIDAFFRYIESAFSRRRKYITLFGGEPLLGSPAQKKLISSFLEKAEAAKIDVCIVTNGYTLTDYADILSPETIREIQVTLDGTAGIHNSRRFLKGGGETFSKIVEGIDACLEKNIPVNLRMVADKENVENLAELADFSIKRGWTSNPLFKTQIGRNYELHHCQSAPDKLYTRVSLYEKLFELTKNYPQITQFHKPSYSISKFLSENGRLPDPLFDSCPACKTEWGFDYSGKIYPCTATVGKVSEALGTYYPTVSLDTNRTYPWESRDITSIQECKDCDLQLACGGGCGSLAKNSKGSVSKGDCRPVKELIEIGFASYF